MIAKTICIVNSKILYELLNELKEELNFDLIEINLKDISKNSFNIKNSIFIVLNNNLSFKRKLENEILLLNELPISLPKLIEKINILYLKMSFKTQSKILINNYEINLNTRRIYLNDKFIDLTEKEIKLISYLSLKKKPCKTMDLQKNIWDYGENMETHTVETHIYRLRKKIKDSFKDEAFILSNNEGYYIK